MNVRVVNDWGRSVNEHWFMDVFCVVDWVWFWDMHVFFVDYWNLFLNDIWDWNMLFYKYGHFLLNCDLLYHLIDKVEI